MVSFGPLLVMKIPPFKPKPEYGFRFDIEENFLDDQSNGWNVQKSQIRSVKRLISVVVHSSCGYVVRHGSRG